MLEKMDVFFEARLDGYDAHMRNDIEGAAEFYPFTAACMPDGEILDLGCGTGLELEYYFQRHPNAQVTGIDLSAGMLEAMKKKFPYRALRLVCGSYFDVELGEGYDGAVSVESLHHFTQEKKTGLYKRLYRALKDGGWFVLTDYFASDDENEAFWRQELARLKAENGIDDDEFYHYDTPLTVAHEIQALQQAGFGKIEVLNHWGATYTLKATKTGEGEKGEG